MEELNKQSFREPKNIKEITVEEIQSRYQHVTMEKGTNGLERYCDYFITDEWVEVEKKFKNPEPTEDKYFLGLKTYRIDKEGKLMQHKGVVSLNKLVHPVPVYKEVNGSFIIEYVQQFRGIPNFKAEPLSVMEYIQKYLAGKCLRSSEETFLYAVPDFIDRKPVFFTPDGNKVKERETCFFDVDEIDIDTLIENTSFS